MKIAAAQTVYMMAITALIHFSGCALTRPTPNTAPAIPDTFSETGRFTVQSNWWLSLNDDELNALIHESLSESLTLRAARSRLDQFGFLVTKSGANAWPTLDVSGQATHRDNQGQSEDRSFWLRGATSFELDLWGKLKNERSASVFDYEQEKSALQVAQITLSATLAKTWYDLAVQQQLATILDQQISINRQILELVDLRFRKGQTSAADVLRQRQLVETRLGQQTLVERQVELLEHQLCVLLGRAPQHDLFIASPLPILPEMPGPGVPGDLLLRRPDVMQAWSSFEAADARAAAAFAARFPSIVLSASTESSGPSLSNLFDFDLRTIAVNLLAPIWSGRALESESKRASSFSEQRYHEFSQACLLALLEVEDSLSSEIHQRQFIESLEQQNKLAKLAYQRIKDQYSHGSSDYLNVLTSLLSWQDLERSLISAKGVQVGYRINLYRALVGPLSQPTQEAQL